MHAHVTPECYKRAIREEAAAKVKNVREGTVEYEIALADAVREVKKRRGLYGTRG